MRETVKAIKNPYFSQVESPHFFDMRKGPHQTSQNFMLAPSPAKTTDIKMDQNDQSLIPIFIPTAIE